MNSNFSEEQIGAYASAFEEGDAIWCDGKWREVSKLIKTSRALSCESPNRYLIRCFDGKLAISGFKEEENPYRITTLEHYELQGGEKLVWMGGELTMAYTTFGKTYKVISDHHGKVYYRDDNGGLHKAGSDGWAVIPRYKQVNCSANPMKKKPKFKVGDTVTLKNYKAPATVRKVELSKKTGSYIYCLHHDGAIANFWEAERDLELYEQVEKNGKEDGNMSEVEVVEESNEVNFDEVAIHSEIITRFVKQTVKGVKKYGDPVKHDNLSAIEWIDHAIDESIDQIVYLTALKQSLMSKGDKK